MRQVKLMKRIVLKLEVNFGESQIMIRWLGESKDRANQIPFTNFLMQYI